LGIAFQLIVTASAQRWHMSQEQTISAATAGSLTIGGDLTVNRIGYGAML
jgi:hypothetical protein